MEGIDLVHVLAQAGPTGIVLFWFMWVAQMRLDRIERSVDRMTRAIVLDVVGRPSAPEAVKVQAQQLLKELDDVQVKRGGSPSGGV